MFRGNHPEYQTDTRITSRSPADDLYLFVTDAALSCVSTEPPRD